jgi:hypothetical protein
MQRPNAEIISLLALLTGTGLSASASLGQNLLSDPGFESGTPAPSGVGGWATPLDASFSQNYAHSGQWSMECYYDPANVHGLSVQSLSAVPGADYTLTGFGLTPTTLGSSAFASLILFFSDSNGILLGSYYNSAPITSSSSVGTWLPLAVSQVAPANAATVSAEVTLFNYSPGDAVYFDDLSLTIVPEPSPLRLAGLALFVCAILRAKREQRSGSVV